MINKWVWPNAYDSSRHENEAEIKQLFFSEKIYFSQQTVLGNYQRKQKKHLFMVLNIQCVSRGLSCDYEETYRLRSSTLFSVFTSHVIKT